MGVSDGTVHHCEQRRAKYVVDHVASGAVVDGLCTHQHHELRKSVEADSMSSSPMCLGTGASKDCGRRKNTVRIGRMSMVGFFNVDVGIVYHRWYK